MARLVVISIVILALTSAFVWYGKSQYKAGENAQKAEYARIIALESDKESEKVKEIIKWKEKEKVIYRDRIKTIKIAEKNECLDTDLRDIGLGGMLRTSSN